MADITYSKFLHDFNNGEKNDHGDCNHENDDYDDR